MVKAVAAWMITYAVLISPAVLLVVGGGPAPTGVSWT